MRFLRERIRLTQKAKGDAKREAESTAQSITSALSTGDADRILEQIKINTQRGFNNTKDRQKQKFERPGTTPVDKTNWVINLSSRSLSDAEIALLKKLRFELRCNSWEHPCHRDYRQGRISRQTTRR